MKETIFREYDIRGIIGQELFIEQAYDLACAIITQMKKNHPSASSIIVARDGREHSPAITQAIIRAITDYGLDVIDIGITPTPVLYFAVKYLDIPTALVVTASHNPKEYNGIKLWGIWGTQIQAIKKIYQEKAFLNKEDNKIGTVTSHDMVMPYIDYMAKQFAHLKGIAINAVIDCGNGAGGIIMPALIEKMEWKNVQLLFEDVDGTFPNHEADPTVPQNMRFVKDVLSSDESLELGIGLDGDCDRMSPMTKDGALVPGDKLLALYAQNVLENNPHAPIVFDIKSSSSLPELLELWGAQPIMSPTGHSIIKESLIRHKALLAGEFSCHFFFNDRYYGFDDGIYAALRLLEILHKSKKSLRDLLAIFPKRISSPEFRMHCTSEEQKGIIVNHVTKIFTARPDAQTITIDGIRAQMDYGWGLVRASNTQTVVSLRFESDTDDGLIRVKQDFFNALLPFFNEKKLKEAIEL
jgi:phosphomannomutase/phosphoglucomutase